MGKSKLDFQHLHIGDNIVTKNGIVGKIVAIKSYEYLNDEIRRNSQVSTVILDMTPFIFDCTKHKGFWYFPITIAIKDPTDKTGQRHYLEEIDFKEIKQIIVEEAPKKEPLIEKIKKILIRK